MKLTVVRIRGQSNAFGEAANATLNPIYQQSFSSIQSFDGSNFGNLNYAINNNQYPPPLNNCGGVEFALTYLLQQYYGAIIYYIKYAVPDTYLGTFAFPTNNWNIATSNSYFVLGNRTTNTAVNYLWNTLGASAFRVIEIWMQGEGDSKNLTDATNYQPNIVNLANATLRSYGTAADVHFIVPKLSTNLFQTATKNTITNASNTNPITITTAAPHTLSTGDRVYIKDVLGNTNANSPNEVVTVTGASTYTIPRVGNGNYISGGGWSPFVYVSTINAAFDYLAANVSNCYALSTDGAQKDSGGVHYTAAGNETIAQNIFNNIIIPYNI